MKQKLNLQELFRIVFAISIVICSNSLLAITTTQPGNWDDNATWGGAPFPTSGNITIAHDVTLTAGKTITISPSLTVLAGVTLYLNDKSLTLNAGVGNVSLTCNGIINGGTGWASLTLNGSEVHLKGTGGVITNLFNLDLQGNAIIGGKLGCISWIADATTDLSISVSNSLNFTGSQILNFGKITLSSGSVNFYELGSTAINFSNDPAGQLIVTNGNIDYFGSESMQIKNAGLIQLDHGNINLKSTSPSFMERKLNNL